MLAFPFHYAIILKETGCCFQYINSMVPNWSVNDENAFSISMDKPLNVTGAYLLKPDMTPAQSADDDANWFHKIWNELDESGNPVEESGFTWETFDPEVVEG